LYVFTFASSTRERECAIQSRLFLHIFSNVGRNSLASRFGYFQTKRASAKSAIENDAESTETWRVIDSGANERSRFVFSRSLLSRLASVRLLTLLFWFVFFSFSADNESASTQTPKKKPM